MRFCLETTLVDAPRVASSRDAVANSLIVDQMLFIG